MTTALALLLAAVALGLAIHAVRVTHSNRAEMAKQVGGIHRAGLDAHRALGAVKGLEAAATQRYLPSTGKHTGGDK